MRTPCGCVGLEGGWIQWSGSSIAKGCPSETDSQSPRHDASSCLSKLPLRCKGLSLVEKCSGNGLWRARISQPSPNSRSSVAADGRFARWSPPAITGPSVGRRRSRREPGWTPGRFGFPGVTVGGHVQLPSHPSLEQPKQGRTRGGGHERRPSG